MRTRLILFLAALLLATSAQAATITWEDPTTRTDGSAFDPSDIAHYTLKCGVVGGPDGDYSWVNYQIPGSAASEHTAPDEEIFSGVDPTNSYRCVLTVTDTNGLESPISNETTHTPEIVTSGPSPPGNLQLAQ